MILNRTSLARLGTAFAVLIATSTIPVEASERSIAVGASVVVKPKYEGSDNHDVYAIPLFVPKFTDSADENPSLFKKIRRRVKFRGLDDIRFRAFGHGRFETGVITGYISDREQSDGRLLRGLGDVDGGFIFGGYAGVRHGDLVFDVALFDKVSGDDAGVQVRLGVETEKQVSERTALKARVGANFASDDYMQTYFGVSPGQAATSIAGLPVYNPDAGLKDVHFETGVEVLLSNRWLLKASGRYNRLLGDAADSPIVESENQFSGSVGLGYRFNIMR